MRFIAALLSLAISTNALAATGQERSRLFKQALEGTATMNQLLLTTALAGQRAEAIRELKNAVREKASSEPIPQVRIREGELFIDNQPVGIRIDPKDPGRVRFKKTLTWTYDKAASPAKNYLSLVKFVDANSGAMGLPFIPEARAEKMSAGMKVGLAVLVAAILVASAGSALAPSALAVALGWIGMGGAVVGAPAAGMIVNDKVASAEVRKILENVALARELTVKCDEQEAVLTIVLNDNRRIRLQFTQSMPQKDGKHEYARILDEKDGHVKHVAQWFGKGPFYNEMMSCKTEEEAAKIKTAMNAAAEEVRKANAETNARQDAPYVRPDPERGDQPADPAGGANSAE